MTALSVYHPGADDHIARLLELEAGWDSYGARPVSLDSANAELRLLLDISTPGTPAPHIAPTARGGLQFEWHTRELDLEIEIVSPMRIVVSYAIFDTGEEGEFTVTSDYRRLTSLVERLSGVPR